MLLGLLCYAAAECARVQGACELTTLCRGAISGGMGNAAAVLYGMLLAAVGGAMLSATGEMAALMLPIRYAEEIGVFAAAASCFLFRYRGLQPLALLGAGLAPCCAGLFVLLLRVPAAEMQPAAFAQDWHAFPSAICYAGLNASLSAGMMCEIGREKTGRECRSICVLAAVLIGGMLLLGNAALLRQHAAISQEALPVVVLSRSLGAAGYWLCAVSILIAVLTSCMAAVRALARMMPFPPNGAWCAAILIALLTAQLDFSRLIGSVYPLLGALCFLCFLRILFKSIKVRS